MNRTNLTVDTAADYLLEANLVGVDAIVRGDLEIVDVGRRNQSLKIVRRHGNGYLIKQAGEGEYATQTTLRQEAWFYSHVWSDPAFAELTAYLPRLCGWDDERSLMTLELVDGRPLWEYYAAQGDANFPADAAAPMGAALGSLHRLFRQSDVTGSGTTAEHNAPVPWILSAHRPTPELFVRSSPANLRVLRLLQQNPALVAGLEALRHQWAADTMIHNDIKGDNILVAAASPEKVRVCLIDWELIQTGDAAWDVGAVFRDFLGYWLLAVPLSADLTPDIMFERALVPMAALHPALRAFWRGYLTTAEAADPGTLLLRSVRSAAARMVQAAYEVSASQHESPNLALTMLQLAANILADPREASLQLLGIPVPWSKPVRASHAH